MRALLVNDDGIDAGGLAVLERAARAVCDEVWVIAPDGERSGRSHAITLAHPLRARERGERRYAISGEPSDCVVLGLREIMKDAPPDIVLSGVNAGFNVADDLTYSGTIGAALEGALNGVRAIAFSQALRPRAERNFPLFSAAEGHCAAVLRRLVGLDLPENVFLNVNFPPCPAETVAGLEVVAQGKRAASTIRVDQREDARGFPYWWLGFTRDATDPAPGTDLRALRENRIAVTPVHADLTARAAMAGLRAALEEGV